MEPRKLLQALMERAGDNPNSLAAKLNQRTKQPQIYKFLEGVSKEPRRSTLQPIAEHYGVSIDAFYDPKIALAVFRGLKSAATSEPRPTHLDQEPAAQYRVALEKDLVISQYAAAGAMGNGGLILEEKQPGVIKSWHVDKEWIRLNVPHYTAASNLCIVTGFGPSMRPKYNPGDPLLLDRGVNVVESEGIYFFRVGKHGFIKQLQRIPTEDGLIIRAKSLNKDYDPFDINEKMDFEVFGKVLTVWRSEQV